MGYTCGKEKDGRFCARINGHLDDHEYYEPHEFSEAEDQRLDYNGKIKETKSILSEKRDLAVDSFQMRFWWKGVNQTIRPEWAKQSLFFRHKEEKEDV